MRLASCLVVALVLGATGCARSGVTASSSAVKTTALSSNPAKTVAPHLVGTEWQLVSYRDPGRTAQIAVKTDSTLEFNGKGSYTAHACNFISGGATIATHTITFTPGQSTQMACRGEPNTLEREVDTTGNGSVSYSIRSRILTLENPNGHVLTYRVRPSIYPNLNARTIIAGNRAGGQFRLAVTSSVGGRPTSLVFEERSAPGESWGVGGMAAPGPNDCLADFVMGVGSLGGKTFLATWAPSNVARVTTRATDNSPQKTLNLFHVPGSALRIAGVWTSTFRPSVSPVIFYDRHGRTIAQYPHGPC